MTPDQRVLAKCVVIGVATPFAVTLCASFFFRAMFAWALLFLPATGAEELATGVAAVFTFVFIVFALFAGVLVVANIWENRK